MDSPFKGKRHFLFGFNIVVTGTKIKYVDSI